MIIWKFEKNSYYQSKNLSKDRDTNFVRISSRAEKKSGDLASAENQHIKEKLWLCFCRESKSKEWPRPCFCRGSSAKIKCDLTSTRDQHIKEELWLCFCRESKSKAWPRPCFCRGSSAKIKCDLASAGDRHIKTLNQGIIFH